MKPFVADIVFDFCRRVLALDVGDLFEDQQIFLRIHFHQFDEQDIGRLMDASAE